MNIVISPDGKATAIYDESVDLSSLGSVTITRASEIEPDQFGEWWVDLSMSGGPKLGPYIKRSVALIAERQWLEDNLHRLGNPIT